MRQDLALLLLRLAFGGLMLFAHGLGKLLNFPARMETFSDPLGVGSQVSLALAVFAEVFCALAVMAGFRTRIAAIPLVITMFVAGFIVHAQDPWAKTEFALLYLVAFAAIALAGPGRYSLDAFRVRKKLKNRSAAISAAAQV